MSCKTAILKRLSTKKGLALITNREINFKLKTGYKTFIWWEHKIIAEVSEEGELTIYDFPILTEMEAPRNWKYITMWEVETHNEKENN